MNLAAAASYTDERPTTRPDGKEKNMAHHDAETTVLGAPSPDPELQGCPS
jgi:hypothetical protein